MEIDGVRPLVGDGHGDMLPPPDMSLWVLDGDWDTLRPYMGLAAALGWTASVILRDGFAEEYDYGLFFTVPSVMHYVLQVANLPSAEGEEDEEEGDENVMGPLNTQAWIDIWSLLSLALIEPIGMVLWMLG